MQSGSTTLIPVEQIPEAEILNLIQRQEAFDDAEPMRALAERMKAKVPA